MKQHYLVKLWLLLLFAACGSAAYAQTGSISGRVLDSQNSGIPGATVVVEGTSLGNSASVDGTYTIDDVPAGPQTVVISYVGYNTVRQPVTVVAGQTTAVGTAKLGENATALGEAVVIGYGTQRKQDLTGAVATVSAKDFVKGQITSPEQLIQGKIAGVSILTGDGAPGTGTQIRIRGQSSLNANSDPLYVIDGVPVDKSDISGIRNPLSLINPNDIETFTVLKDASATAIYGNRASGGVILITTKRGTVGQGIHVDVNSQTSVSTVAKRYEVLSGDELRAIVQANGNPKQFAALGTANTDWQNEVFRTAATYDNNISLTGAAGKIPYRVSYGNLYQEGLVITNYLKRNSGSVSLTPRLFDDHLRVDINAKGTVVDNRFANPSGATFYDPTQPVRINDGTIGQIGGNSDGLLSVNSFNPYGGYFQFLNPSSGAPRGLAPNNPVAAINTNQDLTTVKRLIGNVQFDYKIHGIEGLRANLNLGLDLARSTGSNSVSPDGFGTYNAAAVGVPGLNGSYKESNLNKDMNLLEAYLAYRKQVGGTTFDVQGGYAYQSFVNQGDNFLTYRSDRTTKYTATDSLIIPRFYNKLVLLSFFGRATANVKDKYLLTATVRNDQTSRFNKGYRSGIFPALGLAWRIKGEDFLKDNEAVTELKLRVGYGRTGQQDIGGYYDTQARYVLGSSSAQYLFNNQAAGITYNPIAYNSILTWETTNTYNVGLDLGILDNRVAITVDAYERRATDLLAEVNVPTGSNLTNRLNSNIGTLRNRGIELAVTYIPVQSEAWNWTLNANGAYNENKITDLGPQEPSFIGYQFGDPGVGTASTIQVNSVGYPVNSFYVQKQVYGPDGRPVQGLFANNNAFYRYKQAAPLVTLGFTSNLSYQKLNLAFTLRSNLGNYVYNAVAAGNGNFSNANTATLGFVSNLSRDIYNTGFTDNAQFYSDYYVQNASFLRCENVTLGYNVGRVFADKATLRLTANVQNAFLITKYDGIDPERPDGRDNNLYPRARTYTFGLSLGI